MHCRHVAIFLLEAGKVALLCKESKMNSFWSCGIWECGAALWYHAQTHILAPARLFHRHQDT